MENMTTEEPRQHAALINQMRADLEVIEELSQGAAAIAKALGIGRASVYRMLEA